MNRTGIGTETPAEEAELEAAYALIARSRRKASRWQAREMGAIGVVARIAGAMAERGEPSSRAAELPHREKGAEISSILRISPRTAQAMMGESLTVMEKFPATFAAFAAGRIHRGHVHKILDLGNDIPDAEARAKYEAAVLPVARRESPARTAHVARVEAERVHPRSFVERHDDAMACRGVRVIDLPDGMSELTAILPSAIAHAIDDRLGQMADSVIDARRAEVTGGAAAGVAFGFVDAHAPADTRSTGAVKADVFADIALQGAPMAHTGTTELGAIRGRVQVTVPVLTLMGRSDRPATLAGVGPIDAATARELAGAATGWDRILTDPITGGVLAVDRYTPSMELKRTLQVRDQHCRFPGCRQPVHRSDIDHTLDFALGGETREGNLAHLCRGHHTTKHATRWAVVQKPGGVLEWTSPSGRVYPDTPVSRVMFKPEDDWNGHLARAGAAPEVGGAEVGGAAVGAAAVGGADTGGAAGAIFEPGFDEGSPPF